MAVRILIAIFAQVSGQQVFLRVLLGNSGELATVLRLHVLDFWELFVLAFEGEYGFLYNLVEVVMTALGFVTHFLLVLKLRVQLV